MPVQQAATNGLDLLQRQEQPKMESKISVEVTGHATRGGSQYCVASFEGDSQRQIFLNMTCFAKDWLVQPRFGDQLEICTSEVPYEGGEVVDKDGAVRPRLLSAVPLFIQDLLQLSHRLDTIGQVADDSGEDSSTLLSRTILRCGAYFEQAFNDHHYCDDDHHEELAGHLLQSLHLLATKEAHEPHVRATLAAVAQKAAELPGLAEMALAGDFLTPLDVEDLAEQLVMVVPVCRDILPQHWSTEDFPSQGWRVVPIDEEDVIFHQLQFALRTDPFHLGTGRDVVEAGIYNDLKLKRAWRVEHKYQWRRYEVERNCMFERLLKHPPPPVQLRFELKRCSDALPDMLLKEVNECHLLHGTKCESVLAMLQNGLNERFSRGIFGNGTYFAEDAGKCDQYVSRDSQHAQQGEVKGLHDRIYRRGNRHPSNCYYIFVCRVLLGHTVRTLRGIRSVLGGVEVRDLDYGAPVYATAECRELATIPGSQPPVHYDSLLAELGGDVVRYREFVQFHETRIYPEYLLAYHRR